jgi:8-oxo-dGTP diphosphatase
MKKNIEKLANRMIRELGAGTLDRAWSVKGILEIAGAWQDSLDDDAAFELSAKLWAAALEMMTKGYFYQYPKVDHTVDAVIFKDLPWLSTKAPEVLLVRRGREGEPFYNCWALPGGFVEPGETLEQALIREVAEEVGLVLAPPFNRLELVDVFDAVDRDPRGRVISTAYLAWVSPDSTPKAADDAKECQWFSVIDLPDLAFDHYEIIRGALGKVRWPE